VIIAGGQPAREPLFLRTPAERDWENLRLSHLARRTIMRKKRGGEDQPPWQRWSMPHRSSQFATGHSLTKKEAYAG